MSRIRMFRVNGFDLDDQAIEFYFKVLDDDEHVMFNLRLAGDGMLYYYKPGSSILTPNENSNTRDTPDSYLAMEELQVMFEAKILDD